MKRILLAVLLLLITSAACAEVYYVPAGKELEGITDYALSSEGYYLLVDRDGTVLTPAYTYSMITSIRAEAGENTLFGATPYDIGAVADVDFSAESYDYFRQCLLDAQGNALTDFEFLELRHYPSVGVVTARRPDERWCVLDERGQLLLEGSYGWIVPNGQGGYLALKVDDDYQAYTSNVYPVVYIDAQGYEFDTGYESVCWTQGDFSDGAFLIRDTSTSRFLNAEGEQLFDAEFASANAFSGGYAVVSTDGETYGLIDASGEYALPMRYSRITQPYGEMENTRILALTTDYTLEIYDQNAQFVAEATFDEAISYASQINGSMIGVSLSGKSVYLSAENGERLFEPTEDSWVDGSYSMGGTAPQRAILSSRDWPERTATLVDLQGNPVGSEWRELSALWWNGDQGRFITTSYDIEYFTGLDGQTYASAAGTTYRYGLCDENGEELLPQVYDMLLALAEDRYWARRGDTVGMIDEEGNWLVAISLYEDLMD